MEVRSCDPFLQLILPNSPRRIRCCYLGTKHNLDPLSLPKVPLKQRWPGALMRNKIWASSNPLQRFMVLLTLLLVVIAAVSSCCCCCFCCHRCVELLSSSSFLFSSSSLFVAVCEMSIPSNPLEWWVWGVQVASCRWNRFASCWPLCAHGIQWRKWTLYSRLLTCRSTRKASQVQISSVLWMH